MVQIINFSDLNIPLRTRYYPWEDSYLHKLTPREVCAIYDDHISRELVEKMDKYLEEHGEEMPLHMVPRWADYQTIGRYGEEMPDHYWDGLNEKDPIH